MTRTGHACDHRCLCGRLLAKITTQGVELKCRRCKRIARIPYVTQEKKNVDKSTSGDDPP